MATYVYGGAVSYHVDSEAFDPFFIDPGPGTISEDPTQEDGDGLSGTVNDILEVNEETLDTGVDFGETYIGTATVDGIKMIVTQSLFDPYYYVFTPAGVDPSTINWPASFSDIGFVEEDTVICFAAGTQISNPGGSVAVEDIAVGDPVLTADGKTVPVTWVGRLTVLPLFDRAAAQRLVRIKAGALGAGLPIRDLMLTADHAVMVDGLLLNAGTLVNGASIDYVPVRDLGERYTVYHIETDQHDLILAEGVPAETFVDMTGRKGFDNYDEYLALYGADRVIPEMQRPRISSSRMVPVSLRDRLAPRVPLPHPQERVA